MQDVALSSLTVGVLSFRGGRPQSLVELLLSRMSCGQRLALDRAAEYLESQGATIQRLALEDLHVGEWFECRSELCVEVSSLW